MFKKIVVIVSALVTLFILSGCASSGSPATYESPVTLDGQWHQVKNGVAGTTMSAEISDNYIEITLTIDDTHAIFWAGEFDTDQDLSTSFTVTSARDSDVLDSSLFGSSEATKQFLYENGQLSYQFTILGMSTTVYMEK